MPPKRRHAKTAPRSITGKTEGSNLLRNILIAVAVGVIAVLVGLQFKTRVAIPAHLLGHPALYVPNLISETDGDALMELFKKLVDYPTSTGDQHAVKHSHVGEAQPVVNGTCSHPFLVPDVTKKLCVLPSRIDIGRHFIMGGGLQALKENYADMISRVQSFGRYLFNLDEHPIANKLFADKQFQTAAKKVCPAHQQTLDPFQFNLIIQVPGQTVAMHLDAPWMWGATRFQFPQWLLTSMVGSGLFQDIFVNQVQVVGYFHRWTDTDRAGEFVYWDDESPDYKSVPSTALAGSAVDGSKVVHAATIYRPETKAPRMDKDANNTLSYLGDDKWVVTSNGETIGNYVTDDLRCTIVYRARCFESEAKRQQFLKNFKNEEGSLQLDDILETFRADMEKRGIHSGPISDHLQFAIKIMDTYQPLPLSPTALIPYNYCALTRLAPWLNVLLQFIC